MSAVAIVSAALALMPAATGDEPFASSLRVEADGSAVGALTSSRSAPPAPPAALRGLGRFTCERRPAAIRCRLDALRRARRVHVDYVAFARTPISRTRISATGPR
ncbi:MAG: hypothetical protein AB7V42_16080 [Thermoleophilia bacterium]